MNRCVNCGGTVGATTTTERQKVDGRTFTAELPIERCGSCGEDYFAANVLEAFELAIARELATSGASSGEAFKFMRGAIGMRAADLAALLDVAPETISRWETGARDVDRGALVLVGALVLDHIAGRTDTLERMRAVTTPPRLARTVALDVDALLARRAS